MKRIIFVVFCLGSAACSGQIDAQSRAETDPASTAASGSDFAVNDYNELDNWLCHPNKERDACSIDLTATQINTDGSTLVISHEVAAEPAIDCFYLYPTVSFDTTPNSDMTAGPEELNVIANQFARYSSVCRLFAPIYRQRTLTELQTLMTTGVGLADLEMRYADVRDSWQSYLDNHNDGRGVLLVGHSQGAELVFDLLENEIAGAPIADQLVAAHSIGIAEYLDPATSTFYGFPACDTSTRVGCVVTFASFRATNPPSSQAWFGGSDGEKRSVCTNPANLAENENTALKTYLPAQSFMRPTPNDYGAPVETPFVTLPGLLSGECKTNDTHDWLAIQVNGDPADPRPDNIEGDVVVGGQVLADWGLHLIDVNLAMGDLIDLAASQSDAWLEEQSDE